jgi:ribosomal protein L4
MKAQFIILKLKRSEILLFQRSVFCLCSEVLIAQAIRVTLANRRSSYAKTKTRSEVAGTRKKVGLKKVLVTLVTVTELLQFSLGVVLL